MDLEGDLGAVVRASRQTDGLDSLEFDSCNLLINAGAVVKPIMEVPISISISKAVTIYPSFYDGNPSRSTQSLSPSMFESLDRYYHHATQKPTWSYATAADSSVSAEGKAEKKVQAHDLIMTTTSSNEEEQTSGLISFLHTLSSSPPKGVHVKTPPRSPIRHDDPSAKIPKREPDCRLSSPIRKDSTTEKIDSSKITTPLTKRRFSLIRKPQTKKTVLIPATEGSWNKPGGGGVASDIWAWRKYGQKPIKGSPYPRSYYRCSSCKGCPARKQVERSHRDPTMLEITYTAEHNHAWPTSNHRNGTTFTGTDSSTHKDMMTLAVPHSPQKSDVPAAQGSNPAGSRTEDMIEEEKPRSQPATDCLDFDLMVATVEDHDQTADLHMLRSNHMHYDDLFADLGELKDFARYSADYKSDEETGSTTVDPYNLFNWSSSSSTKTPADA